VHEKLKIQIRRSNILRSMFAPEIVNAGIKPVSYFNLIAKKRRFLF